MDKFLSRDDTKVMKAIAIILMLAHHLWILPERIAGGSLRYVFQIFGQSSIVYLGWFGKICVSLFFFLGGYGIYISSYGKKYDVISKLKGLYFSYWKVFVIFIPMGFLFFRNQPAYCENHGIYARFENFSVAEFLANITGIDISYTSEWWFLTSYVFAILSFPVIRGMVEKHSARRNILSVIIASIVVTNVLPAIGNIEAIGSLNNNYLYAKLFCQSSPYIASFWMGAVVAENGLLDRLNESLEKNHLLNPCMDIIIWAICIYFRQTGIGDSFDIIYIPFLIVTSKDLLERVPHIRKIFLHIGKESTNMWLIHPFFCYYFYPFVKIVVAPRWALPSLFILIVMSYLASVMVDYIWKGILYIPKRIKKC